MRKVSTHLLPLFLLCAVLLRGAHSADCGCISPAANQVWNDIAATAVACYGYVCINPGEYEDNTFVELDSGTYPQLGNISVTGAGIGLTVIQLHTTGGLGLQGGGFAYIAGLSLIGGGLNNIVFTTNNLHLHSIEFMHNNGDERLISVSDAAALILEGCSFVNNTVSTEAILFEENNVVYMTGCLFRFNTFPQGGVYAPAVVSLTIVNTGFTGNSVNYMVSGYGAFNITGCLFYENLFSTHLVGTSVGETTTMTISDTVFYFNYGATPTLSVVAASAAGSVYLERVSVNNTVQEYFAKCLSDCSMLMLTECTVYGAGVQSDQGTLTIAETSLYNAHAWALISTESVTVVRDSVIAGAQYGISVTDSIVSSSSSRPLSLTIRNVFITKSAFNAVNCAQSELIIRESIMCDNGAELSIGAGCNIDVQLGGKPISLVDYSDADKCKSACAKYDNFCIQPTLPPKSVAPVPNTCYVCGDRPPNPKELHEGDDSSTLTNLEIAAIGGGIVFVCVSISFTAVYALCRTSAEKRRNSSTSRGADRPLLRPTQRQYSVHAYTYAARDVVKGENDDYDTTILPTGPIVSVPNDGATTKLSVVDYQDFDSFEAEATQRSSEYIIASPIPRRSFTESLGKKKVVYRHTFGVGSPEGLPADVIVGGRRVVSVLGGVEGVEHVERVVSGSGNNQNNNRDSGGSNNNNNNNNNNGEVGGGWDDVSGRVDGSSATSATYTSASPGGTSGSSLRNNNNNNNTNNNANNTNNASNTTTDPSSGVTGESGETGETGDDGNNSSFNTKSSGLVSGSRLNNNNSSSHVGGSSSHVVGSSKHASRHAAAAAAHAHEALCKIADVDADNATILPTMRSNGEVTYRAEFAITIDDTVSVMDMNDPTVELIGKLGSGSFGDVYHYTWNYIDVAVKVVKSVEKTSVQEFIEEAQTLAQLRCPFCVSYAGIALEPLAIVTEYMEGGDVAAFLKQPPEVCTWERKQGIVLNVAKGLAFLHSNGIAHRDLKPANILLSKHYEAKLADFGLSGDKLLDLSGAGTLSYCAPEVLHGAVADEASDVYSFACVMIEIMGGERPFGKNPKARKTNPELKPVEVDGVEFTGDGIADGALRSLIGAMLVNDPRERATIVDVLNVMKAVL